MDYLKAFLVGGAICMLGQLLIDKQGLRPRGFWRAMWCWA